MYGAILGDIIGSPYEFDRGNKTKDFPLFTNASTYTDDSVMTIAVADGLMNAYKNGVSSEEWIKDLLIDALKNGDVLIPMQDMVGCSDNGY